MSRKPSQPSTTGPSSSRIWRTSGSSHASSQPSTAACSAAAGSVAPNPKGALALLRRLESLVGVTVDAGDLETAAADYDRQVTRAVELDPEVQAFVERLERAADEEEAGEGDLPSGDVLAREFQRFLRQRGSGGPPPHASN